MTTQEFVILAASETPTPSGTQHMTCQEQEGSPREGLIDGERLVKDRCVVIYKMTFNT